MLYIHILYIGIYLEIEMHIGQLCYVVAGMISVLSDLRACTHPVEYVVDNPNEP